MLLKAIILRFGPVLQFFFKSFSVKKGILAFDEMKSVCLTIRILGREFMALDAHNLSSHFCQLQVVQTLSFLKPIHLISIASNHSLKWYISMLSYHP